MRETDKCYRQEWMSDDQWECACLMADIVEGFHHVPSKIKPWGTGIETSIHGSWATFDFNQLTVAVVLAHDRMIRVEVSSSSPRLFKIMFHKRESRKGSISRRHPTLEDAMLSIRSNYAEAQP